MFHKISILDYCVLVVNKGHGMSIDYNIVDKFIYCKQWPERVLADSVHNQYDGDNVDMQYDGETVHQPAQGVSNSVKGAKLNILIL